MHADLESLREEVEDARRRGADLVQSLTPEQMNWRCAAGSWSIAECLEHVSVTNDLYSAAIRKALEQAGKSAASSPTGFRYGWFEKAFLRRVEPPVKLKFKAPRGFQPASNLDIQALRKHWEDSHDAFAGLIGHCDGIALDRVKVQSPVTRLLKFSLGITLKVIPAHARRHLWQVEQLKGRPGFPAATRGAASQS